MAIEKTKTNRGRTPEQKIFIEPWTSTKTNTYEGDKKSDRQRDRQKDPDRPTSPVKATSKVGENKQQPTRNATRSPFPKQRYKSV